MIVKLEPPFGLTMDGLNYYNRTHESKFKFNGKELHDDYNLDWFYYGASIDDLVNLFGSLQSQSTNADNEHKTLKNGKDQDYNQYMKELKESK